MEDIKSTTRMAFKLGNAAVSWGSKKQDITALSTTEAEYVAATTAACQGVWLRRMLEECELKQSTPTVIWCDNLSTIAILKILHIMGEPNI